MAALSSSRAMPTARWPSHHSTQRDPQFTLSALQDTVDKKMRRDRRGSPTLQERPLRGARGAAGLNDTGQTRLQRVRDDTQTVGTL